MNNSAGSTPSPLTVPALLVVVALAGGATMVVELGAVRLLSPWFGTSSSVWTNVIGVVLAALALGYALGARLATGRDPLRTLGITLLVGAACAAWLPRLTPIIGEAFMPTGVALHGAAGLLVWGSLAAATLLFLPAATALGCAGPLAVEVLQRTRGGAAGRAGGHVLATSTVGSLAGTFGTTHLFVPVFGITKTFLFASAVLAACGVVLLVTAARGRGRSERRVLGLMLLLVCAGATASAGAPRAREADGRMGTELDSRESAMQSLRVVEQGSGEERMRFLQVNESLDSFQSVWQPRTGLLGPGRYYDHFALPYAWRTRESGTAPASWDLLIIGLGAGTAVRVLEGVVAPETDLRTVGIEIDPVVVELGERWFELESDGDRRVVIGGLDGRAALRLSDRMYDQIVVDAYANNMEIPPHLASVEAFRAVDERLVEGGWLTVNVGGFGPDDPVVKAVAAAAAIGLQTEVHIARVPLSRNLTLFARKGGEVPRPRGSAFGSRGMPLVGGVGSLLPPLEVEGAWTTLSVEDAAGHAQTDDTSAMERLQLQSIQLAEQRLREIRRSSVDRSRLEPAPTAARDDIDLAEAARALGADHDLVGALEAADSIQDGGARAALRAELLWVAGDPFRALEIAAEGLVDAPGDLGLLALAVDLSLVVGAAEVAREWLGDLEAVVGRAELDGGAFSWWESRVERLSGLTDASLAAGAERDRALTRARSVALMALLATVLGVIWVSRHPVQDLRATA